jgi:hypothetical protein
MMRPSAMPPLLIALAACGGVAQSTPDAGGGSGLDAAEGDEPTAHTGFLSVLHAGADLCMPQSLPVDSLGQVPCSIFVLPPAATACVPASGLSAVDAAVAASVRTAGGAAASQLVCQLAQLPEAAWVNGSCVDTPAAGWCYLTGAAAGGGCAQAIRFSASGTPASGDKVLLGCQ